MIWPEKSFESVATSSWNILMEKKEEKESKERKKKVQKWMYYWK